MNLTDAQRRALVRLWFRFGNEGPEHTMANHRFIQDILEKSMDRRAFFKPEAACVAAVDAVLTLSHTS